jgi:hypothetical protein
MRLKLNRDAATIVSPPAISQRGPQRSESRPATGATPTIISVEGRNRIPASSGE